MAASGKVLGTVTSVVGEAKATAADGTVRILQVGDIIRSDETITTSAAGAVNIALENGKTLDCGANTDLSLHEGILGVSTAASNVPGAPGAAAPGSVEALQQAIASGQDPSQIAPATAAGGAPAAGGAGGDGSGGTPVIIEQANTSGPITAGFGTAGAGIAFPTPEFQLLPPTEQQPVVSVSVQVQVEVGVTPGETPGHVTVPTNPVVSTNATGIVEGTDGEETRLVNFIIKLSQSFDTDVQVTYTIVSGPANPAFNADAAQTPSDYSGVLTATITIPAGATEFIVPVQIVQDHFVENNENFSIVLTGAENATIDPNHSSAVVTIQDDDTAPVAHADTNWTQEDAHLVATGNVIAGQAHAGAPSGSFADTQDTDADGDIPHVTTTGTFNGTYGTLALNADGTYTYTLNNASAAVQGLDAGETLNDSFNYTASDGFNAPTSSTLTVTIFGSNDVPTITVRTDPPGGGTPGPFADSASGVVDEAALASGSNPPSNAEFVTGSLRLADTDGLDDIQSVTVNGTSVAIGSIVGAVFHGVAGDMTITSYSGGIANFTYELKNAVTDVANQAETDVFSISTSDGTASSNTAMVTITIIDDVPSISVVASQAADALVVDETNLAANATANFADNFTSSPAFHADGPGSVSSSYALSVGAGSTGLVDTATGQAVTLIMNAGVVEGHVSNGEGGFFVVFTLAVTGSGTVTLDQQRAVVHANTSNPDDSTGIASGLVALTRTDTITDSDGDSANSAASIDIGTALSFKDDGPSIDVSLSASADALTVDETNLELNASANFADNFSSSSSFGADGAGSVSSAYALSINAGATGLVDTATGQAVTLVMNAGVVEGHVSNGEGSFIVFTLAVTGSGTVTLDQQRAVVHANTSNPDDSTGIASGLVTLTRTDTITDKDGDTSNDSASLDVGAALSFKDDGPSIDITSGGTSVTEGQGTNGNWTRASGADVQATTKVIVNSTEYNLDSAIDTGKGTLTVNSNGTWTFNSNLNQVNPQTMTFTVKITDKDGDSATDSHSVTINDGAGPGASGPQVMTVNEAALADGTNPASTTEEATAALQFTSGSDSIASIKFDSNTAGITIDAGWDTPQSITWTVSPDGRTLTGNISGEDVMRVVLTGATTVAAGGSIGNVTATATLLNDFRHQDAPDADSLVISQIKVVATDTDGTTATHTFTGITVNDDAPVVSGFSNIYGFNTQQPLTGTYAINVGADEVANAQVDGLVLQTLTGTTANGRAITDQAVTWSAETNTTVTFNFSFKYFPGPSSTVADTATGTVVFNKTNGTYTFDLDAPIGSETTFSTSSPLAQLNYDTQDNNSPEIVIQQYAIDFFGALTARSGPSGGTSGLGTTNGDGTNQNLAYVNGDLLENDNVNYLNVSTATVGVGSDVVHPDDMLNFDFYKQNPAVGTPLPAHDSTAHIDPSTPKAYADSMSIELNQLLLGHEDIAILLKLENRTNPADKTTVLLIANDTADYVPLANGNHLVTVGQDDYNSAQYHISGVQIVSTTDDLTGSGTSLTGHSSVTLTSTGSDLQDTSDSDNIKIIKINLVTSTTSTFDTDLHFGGQVVDADRDTANFSFNVHLEANTNVLTGTAQSDYLNGTSAADSMVGGDGNDILAGGTGNDIMTGGNGNDTFKYNAANEGADTINGFTVGNPSSAVNADVLDISELLVGAGISQATFLASPGTYLQVVAATNTTVSFDADGGDVGASVLLVTLQGVNVTLATLLANNEIKSS